MPEGDMARVSRSSSRQASVDAEEALRAFIAEFDPVHQRLIGAVRAVLRRRLPAANELAYDNYNFFVIGYCASLRPSDALLSIAASARGVSLCFIHGASLADPSGLLQGSGKQTRFLRITSVEDLDRPEVRALVTAATASLPDGPPGVLVIRSVSARRRARRKDPAEADHDARGGAH
jgi:hypothetical protein